MSQPLTEDGTLAVRVTMNPRLRRAAFAGTVLHLVWCVVVIVPSTLLLVSWPEPALVVISLIVIAWCCWVIWRTVPPARRKYRALSMGVPTLVLDDLGVRVRDVPMHLDGAALAWSDCVAVVASLAPKGPEWPVQPVRYVQFVPVSEDRVESTGIKRRDVRPDLLGLSEIAASVTWLELPGVKPDADDVMDWIKAHRPGTRLVGAGHSVTDE